MTRIRLGLSVTIVALAIACAATANARSDGLPVLGIDAGPTEIATPDEISRYVTLPAGADSVVARVAQDSGRVLASRPLLVLSTPEGFLRAHPRDDPVG